MIKVTIRSLTVERKKNRVFFKRLRYYVKTYSTFGRGGTTRPIPTQVFVNGFRRTRGVS